MAFTFICHESDVEAGRAAPYTVDDVELLVCNVEGTFYCIENVCTHDGAPLDQGVLEGTHIECPRHGAIFDVTTGAVLQLPAVLPLPTYTTTVSDGSVLAELC